MKILKVDQRSDEWDELRKGKITGSKLKDIITLRGSGKKIGYYQLIADRIADDPGDGDMMERGIELETEAIKLFEDKSGCKVEQVGFCVSDESENIAVSPDGLIKIDGKYREAIEIKCLNSAMHIKSFIENKIPKEHEFQVLQYFIVIEDLEKLHFVMYDPRIKAKPYLEFEVLKEDVQEKVEKYKEYQLKIISEVEEITERLAF